MRASLQRPVYPYTIAACRCTIVFYHLDQWEPLLGIVSCLRPSAIALLLLLLLEEKEEKMPVIITTVQIKTGTGLINPIFSWDTMITFSDKRAVA